MHTGMDTTSLAGRVDERWQERGKQITCNNLFGLFAICFIFRFSNSVQYKFSAIISFFFPFAIVEGRREGRLKGRKHEKWEEKK